MAARFDRPVLVLAVVVLASAVLLVGLQYGPLDRPSPTGTPGNAGTVTEPNDWTSTTLERPAPGATTETISEARTSKTAMNGPSARAQTATGETTADGEVVTGVGATATTTAVVAPTTRRTSTATATATATATPTTTATDEREPAFQFDIGPIENCGFTCRSVTTSLTNRGSGPATGVVVDVTLSTEDRQIWEGSEPIGGLGVGERRVVTRDVDVGLRGAVAIRANDGAVAIEVTVRHDDGVDVFRTTRDVT